MEAARVATPEDLEAVVWLAEIARTELRDLRGGPVWFKHQARRDPVRSSLERDLALAPDRAVVVVGTVGDEIVGYGVVRYEDVIAGEGPDVEVLAVVTDIYVAPDARGIGVGEAMLDLLIERSRAAGAIGIDSLALPGDRATKNFFETFGLKARAIVVHRSFDSDASDEVSGAGEGEGRGEPT